MELKHNITSNRRTKNTYIIIEFSVLKMPTSQNPLPKKVSRPNSTSRNVLPPERTLANNRGGRELPKKSTGRVVKPSQSSSKTGSMINILTEGRKTVARYMKTCVM